MNVNYKNTTIHLDKYGKGNAFFLIHGFFEERNIWNELIPKLEENNVVICPDLFGHGETPVLSEVHTMEEMADAVAFIMDELKIESASLIGHSMGGYISMAFLEKYPERADRIMLLNSSPKEDSAERLIERDQVIKIVPKHKQIFIKSAVTKLFAEESRIQFEDKLNQRIEAAMKMEVNGILAATKGMKIRKDREWVLKNHTGTKWIVAGEEDALIPIETLKNIAQNTDTKLVELPGGHMSYIEQREKVIKAIDQFLKQ